LAWMRYVVISHWVRIWYRNLVRPDRFFGILRFLGTNPHFSAAYGFKGCVSCGLPREPFTGIIDKVAYCDFALTLSEISSHSERSMKGLPYYDHPFELLSQDRWKAIAIVRAGSTRVFDVTTDNLPIEN
jgi:hypothetical protein